MLGRYFTEYFTKFQEILEDFGLPVIVFDGTDIKGKKVVDIVYHDSLMVVIVTDEKGNLFGYVTTEEFGSMDTTDQEDMFNYFWALRFSECSWEVIDKAIKTLRSFIRESEDKVNKERELEQLRRLKAKYEGAGE